MPKTTTRPPLSQLNRPLHVGYVLNAGEFEDWVKQRRTPNASTIYRVLYPVIGLNAEGRVQAVINDSFAHTKDTEEFTTELNPYLAWCDFLIFCRLTTTADEIHLKLLRDAKKMGVMLGLEHDDNYFNFNRGVYGAHKFEKAHIDLVRATAKECDILISPNPILNAETMKECDAHPLYTAAIPNAVLIQEWEKAAKNRTPHKGVRILLAGANNHTPDFLRMMPVLKKIKQAQGDNVQVHVLGVDRRTLQLSFDREKYMQSFTDDLTALLEQGEKIGVSFHGPVDMSLFPHQMNKLSPDIGVIITSDNTFDRCKSSLKYVDYTMSGAAIACSKQSPYTDELSSSEVLFASTDAEWYDVLTQLIMDSSLRHNQVRHNEKIVCERYSVQAVAPLYADAFEAAYVAKWGA